MDSTFGHNYFSLIRVGNANSFPFMTPLSKQLRLSIVVSATSHSIFHYLPWCINHFDMIQNLQYLSHSHHTRQTLIAVGSGVPVTYRKGQ
jgi:hypothetical protein